MKKFLLVVLIFVCSQCVFAEYVVINRIVYSLDLSDLTATVKNFQTSTSGLTTITIPPKIVYKNEVYKVTSLSYYAFDFDAFKDYVNAANWIGYEAATKLYSIDDGSKREEMERKFKYQYDEARANIEYINLPSTLTEISDKAFSGMRRLKKIVLPASIKKLDEEWFGDNSRLEFIILEGIPCCRYFDYDRCGLFSGCTFCLDEVPNPIASLDTVTMTLKKRECPNLKAIKVLPFKDFLFYKDKLDKSYETYSKQLLDTIWSYRNKLTSHPYYYVDKYFNDISMSEPILSSSKTKENYATQSASLKKEYNRQLTLCRDEYKELWNSMEQNCKLKSPYIYAERYCVYHPEFSAKIDSLLKDYKCDYTKQELVLNVLNNSQLGEKCQDKLWRQYSNLYKDKETFLSEYDKSSDVKRAIGYRERVYQNLRNYIKTKSLRTKGLYDMGDSKTNYFRDLYNDMKRESIPVGRSIIERDPKALKEFEKNGQYFESTDEFFAAYITANYNTILKAKKKEKK